VSVSEINAVVRETHIAASPEAVFAYLVEITLSPDADGTRVRLVHRGLPTSDAREAHGHGWAHYLNRLSIASVGRDPGADPNANPST
jgi:uncharacterized protein YndB with AHSA1/START domain